MVIEDVAKSFSCTRDLDVHGRLDTVIINIKGYEQYKLELDYNGANQVILILITCFVFIPVVNRWKVYFYSFV